MLQGLREKFKKAPEDFLAKIAELSEKEKKADGETPAAERRADQQLCDYPLDLQVCTPDEWVHTILERSAAQTHGHA